MSAGHQHACPDIADEGHCRETKQQADNQSQAIELCEGIAYLLSLCQNCSDHKNDTCDADEYSGKGCEFRKKRALRAFTH